MVPSAPDEVADCNCSICRRYGVLWAYYPRSQVSVSSASDTTDHYVRGDRTLRFVRCAACGCVMFWERIVPVEGGKTGVNARNFDPEVLAPIPRVFLDGASD